MITSRFIKTLCRKKFQNIHILFRANPEIGEVSVELAVGILDLEQY